MSFLQDMSAYVKKIQFKLHESYTNPLRGKQSLYFSSKLFPSREESKSVSVFVLSLDVGISLEVELFCSSCIRQLFMRITNSGKCCYFWPIIRPIYPKRLTVNSETGHYWSCRSEESQWCLESFCNSDAGCRMWTCTLSAGCLIYRRVMR